MIKLVQQVTKEPAESRPAEQGRNKQPARHCDAIHQRGESDVRDEKQEQRSTGESAGVRLSGLAEVEQLTNRNISLAKI